MIKNELYLLFEKILLEDNMNNQYLVGYCFEKLNQLFTDTIVSNDEKQQINLYYKNLNKFFLEIVHEILNYKNEIAYNYFKILYVFFQYLELPSRSIGYLSEYRIFAVRTMEVALVLQKYNIEARDILLHEKKHSQEFYINLLRIYQIDFTSKISKNSTQTQEVQILTRSFEWKTEGLGINIGHFDFRLLQSTVKSPWGTGTKKPTLREYLKLDCLGVYQVYNQIPKENKGDGGGGLGVKLIPLDPFPKRVYDEGKIVRLTKESVVNEKNKAKPALIDDNDEKYESVAKSNKRIKSLRIPSKPYGIYDSVQEYNWYITDEKSNETLEYKIEAPKTSSKYKEARLNKSIGHLSAKAHLYLPSRYNIPDVEILCNFLSNIEDKKSYEYKILVTTILLGIDLRQIIAINLKLPEDIRLVNKKFLRVSLTTAYAQTRSNSFFKTTKKYIEFALSGFLVNNFKLIESVLFNKLNKLIEEKKAFYDDATSKAFDGCKTISQLLDFLLNQYGQTTTEEILNKYLDDEIKHQKKYLQKEKKRYPKHITINISTLHLYSFYYYKFFHKESDITYLFLKKKTANIHTKLTYVASPTKIFNITIWLEELSQILNLEYSGTIVYATDSQCSGTNKLLLPQEYKNFLMILSKIKFENKYANLTLIMIYLRYIFCVLLATRKYYFSCDLQQFSKKKMLLFFHEKAKNSYSSKRIVPVTDLGLLYIEKFYRLKDEYNLLSFSPVIVDDAGKEKPMQQENIMEWLHVHKDEMVHQWSLQQYEFIENFITTVVRDFGRHIFASEAHNYMSIDQDYTDAFLNHFYRGTQDQGMYSSFDNQEYFMQARELMNVIQKRYIPYWKEIGA